MFCHIVWKYLAMVYGHNKHRQQIHWSGFLALSIWQLSAPPILTISVSLKRCKKDVKKVSVLCLVFLSANSAPITICFSCYLPFILVGIAVTILLFTCNFTVVDGRINGLIFYANIVSINDSVFFPSYEPTKYVYDLTSFLNLNWFGHWSVLLQ